jgi:hypothetical protein
MAKGPQIGVNCESLLRERLNRFLTKALAHNHPLRRILQIVAENAWQAVVFGGVLRDLVAFGVPELPRDIDIVIDGVSIEQLAEELSSFPHQRTRFGGIRLISSRWLIDLWPLSQTWAFREYGLPCGGFADLPKTTFLNVEAVAARLPSEVGRPRKIYESGFFQAISTRVLDINLEPNPYPALCVIRSLICAAKLDFCMSRTLADYIVTQSSCHTISDLIDVQISHYGTARLGPSELIRWLTSIDKQLQVKSDAVKLPLTKAEQLLLSEDWIY